VAERTVDNLLIGGGLASANCARWLREEGGEDAGSILLVGRENDPPYNRPPLSKSYLGGKEKREDILFRPDEWWGEQKIDLLTRTSVTKLDAEGRKAKLSNGDEVSFDKALLATGANVRRLRAEHSDLEGIHYLRTIPTSDAIARDASETEHVVLIGGSYIGCEVAATLTARGNKCTIVMMEDVTFERVYGPEVGRFFQGVLEEHDVEIHGGESLAGFEGADGRVTHVLTESGLKLEAGCVVIGAGVAPDVTLAKAAGLEIGESGGVVCSSGLETSVPGIYAAGDICDYDSVVHGRRLRIEHWDVAFNMGKTTAFNMLGRDIAHEEVPYFFSDLADWASSEYVGPGSGDTVVRGSMDDGEFTAFYVDPDSGAVTAALTVGRSDDLEHARRFIKEKTTPDREKLADTGTDLGDL
jgi:3-phenylpropionate/trans-cinnamate dioxygenase ferredoxin reductase component